MPATCGFEPCPCHGMAGQVLSAEQWGHVFAYHPEAVALTAKGRGLGVTEETLAAFVALGHAVNAPAAPAPEPPAPEPPAAPHHERRGLWAWLTGCVTGRR